MLIVDFVVSMLDIDRELVLLMFFSYIFSFRLRISFHFVVFLTIIFAFSLLSMFT